MALLSLLLKILLTLIFLACFYVWYWVDTMRVYEEDDSWDL
jgi:hypothetical protein